MLAPNYRGSRSFGRSFMEELYCDWGDGDLHDNKVLAMDGSAGGYSTRRCGARSAGKDVEYHVYPREGHGWRKASTQIDDARRIDHFLTRKVLNR